MSLRIKAPFLSRSYGKSSESPFISVDAERCGDSSLKLTSVLKGDSPDHVKAFLFRSKMIHLGFIEKFLTIFLAPEIQEQTDL
jgi:hypothetical protein